MKVKEEKNVKTIKVRFETSTSPSWKDIKKFIRYYFFLNINIIRILVLLPIMNLKELLNQK